MKHSKARHKRAHRLRALTQIFEPLEARQFLSGLSAPQATALAGIYHTTAELSQARSATSVVVGHDMLFAGGELTTLKGKTYESDVVDIYDSITGQWSVAHLSVARHGMATDTVGDTEVFVGGYTGLYEADPSYAIDVFNSDTNSWSHYTPNGNIDGSATVVGDKLVFAGGFNDAADNQPSGFVQIFDATTGQWSTATLSVARAGMAATVVGDTLVLAGGYTIGAGNTDIASNAVDVFNAGTNTWSTATLSEPRFGQAVTVGPYVLVTGGAIDNSDSNNVDDDQSQTVDVYDSEDGVWSVHQVGPNATGDSSLYASVFGNEAVVTSDEEVGIFNASSGQWTAYSYATNPNPINIPVRTNPFALLNGKLLFGESSYGNAYIIQILDLSTGQVTTHTLDDAHDGEYVEDGKLIFAGGEETDSGYSPSSEIEIYDSATNSWSVISASDDLDGATAIAGKLYFSADDETGYGIDVFDPATGTLTRVMSSGNEVFAVGQDVLTAAPYAGNATVDIFTPSNIGEPADPSIADGAGVAAAPSAFTWDACEGATSYNVYFDEQLVANVTQPSWTPATPISSGLHSWQIVATDGSQMTAGPRWTFTVGLPAAPTNPSVANGAQLDVSPTALAWSPAAGAASYTVYLDGVRLDRTTATSLQLSEPVAGGKHVWAVVAQNAFGQTVSSAWTFYTPASNLIHTSKITNYNYAIGGLPLALGDLEVISEGGYNGGSGLTFYGPTTSSLASYSLDVNDSYATAVVGTQAIFAGGDTSLETFAPSNEVQIYDAATGNWSRTTFSQARESILGASVGPLALFAGGDTLGKNKEILSSAIIDLFNSTTGKWSIATLSQARDVAAAVTLGSQVIFAGGESDGGSDDSGTPSGVVDIFNAITGRWTRAQLSTPSAQLTAFTVGHRAYFAGKQAMDVYDQRTSKWASVSVPQDLSESPVAVVGTRAYFAGESSISIFDTRSGQWSSFTPQGYAAAAVTAVGSDVIFAPGFNSSGEPGDTVDILNSTTGQWSDEKLSAASAYSVTAFTRDGTAVVISSGSQPGTSIDYFSDPTLKWSLSGSLGQIASGLNVRSSTTVNVSVSNSGTAEYPGPFDVDIYAVSNTAHGRPVLLGHVLVSSSLSADGKVKLSVPISFGSLKAGQKYQITAVVRGLGGDTTQIGSQTIAFRG